MIASTSSDGIRIQKAAAEVRSEGFPQDTEAHPRVEQPHRCAARVVGHVWARQSPARPETALNRAFVLQA